MRVLVTGAARGLGRAFTLALAADGHTVLGADVDELGLAETAARRRRGGPHGGLRRQRPGRMRGGGGGGGRCFGGLDALVNNAGIITVSAGRPAIFRSRSTTA